MAPRQRLSASPPPEDDDRSRSPQMVRKTTTSTTMSTTTSAITSKEDCTKKAEDARDLHDLFNLVALMPINSLNLANWDWTGLLQGQSSLETAWTGNYFLQLWGAAMLYFLVDLAWVANIPICVKSPGVIVKHHVLVVFYLMAPMMWPQYRWFMGACLTVEINTWFLIARRWCFRKSVPGWTKRAVSWSFYVSWVAIRCGVYPTILYIFLTMVDTAYTETGTILHWPIVFLPIHCVLCVLNIKWTYDLFRPIAKKLLSGSSATQQQPSSGL